ncbi:hypothetical protein VUR80DRAFT_4554 [Thermomyces stellatus]
MHTERCGLFGGGNCMYGGLEDIPLERKQSQDLRLWEVSCIRRGNRLKETNVSGQLRTPLSAVRSVPLGGRSGYWRGWSRTNSAVRHSGYSQVSSWPPEKLLDLETSSLRRPPGPWVMIARGRQNVKARPPPGGRRGAASVEGLGQTAEHPR